MATIGQLYFIEPASLQMEGILYLHEHIFGLLCGILVTVLILYRRVILRAIGIKSLFSSLYLDNVLNKKRDLYYFIEQKMGIFEVNLLTKKFLELFWTIVPACILLYIAGPSFALLYSMDEIVPESFFTVLVEGSQWYWSYEYYIPVFDHNKLGVSSYMIADIDLEEGQKRLLDVNAPIYIPRDLTTRFLITATDVLHAWAIPSLGLKVDAVPGRLNQILVQPLRSGVFFGQCSEICGTNHGFMPITIYCIEVNKLISIFEEVLVS
jgi:cytochrome c oxidase subunit 2